jgi:hypothetical protein
MKYYMINTNRKADPYGHDEETMLNEQIVSLYFEGHKEKIDKLNDGDVVFLYSNENGVIACGEVYGATQKRNYKGLTKFKNEEYFKKFKSVVKPQQPVTVKQMKTLFGKRPLVIQSFTLLSEANGQILLDTVMTKVPHSRVA